MNISFIIPYYWYMYTSIAVETHNTLMTVNFHWKKSVQRAKKMLATVIVVGDLRQNN